MRQREKDKVIDRERESARARERARAKARERERKRVREREMRESREVMGVRPDIASSAYVARVLKRGYMTL